MFCHSGEACAGLDPVAGIQSFQMVTVGLGSGACPGPRSGVHRSDDFSRNRQSCSGVVI